MKLTKIDDFTVRIDLAATYLMPLQFKSWQFSWVNSLGYYLLNYTDRSDNRKDNNFSYTTTLSKKLNGWLTMGLTANYTKNSSNVSDSSYSKYSVLTTFSADCAF